MSAPQVAVQLYTVRDLLAKDFVGTLKQVAHIGYQAVELAGTGNLSAVELKKTLADLNLKTAGAHVGIEQLEGDFDKTVAYYKEAGVSTIIIPWWPEERRKTREDWLANAAIIDKIGAKLTPLGFSLLYHNHDFEFKTFDGAYALDLLLDNAHSVGAELDTFWVTFAGENAAAYITKRAGRVQNIHVKDMQAGPEKKFSPVGQGIIDWKPIFAAARAAGVKWFVAEQDNCYDLPPLESIRISFENLKKMGVA